MDGKLAICHQKFWCNWGCLLLRSSTCKNLIKQISKKLYNSEQKRKVSSFSCLRSLLFSCTIWPTLQWNMSTGFVQFRKRKFTKFSALISQQVNNYFCAFVSAKHQKTIGNFNNSNWLDLLCKKGQELIKVQLHFYFLPFMFTRQRVFQGFVADVFHRLCFFLCCLEVAVTCWELFWGDFRERW